MRKGRVKPGRKNTELRKKKKPTKTDWRKVKYGFLKQFGRRVRKGKQSGLRSTLIGLMETKIIGKS